MDQGKADEAVACYRRTLTLNPASADAHNNLGNALKDQGKLDEAVGWLARALELKPAYAEAHSNLGNALKDQGKLDEAIACYRRALELKADYAVAHNNLGSALEESGDLAGAEACFRAACGTIPASPSHITSWRNCWAASSPSRTWPPRGGCWKRRSRPTRGDCSCTSDWPKSAMRRADCPGRLAPPARQRPGACPTANARSAVRTRKSTSRWSAG